MNLQTLHAQLNQLERKRQQLEKRIKERASKQYASLPAKLGLKNIDDLILELLPYGSSTLRTRLNHNGAESSRDVNDGQTSWASAEEVAWHPLHR